MLALNIKKDHLKLLTSIFPLVVSKENAGKLQEELLDYQTANETEPPKENDENNKRSRFDQYWFKISKLLRKSHVFLNFLIWQYFLR